MKILILDDEPYRHDEFDRTLGSRHEVHHVYSVRQFRHALGAHSFEMICFDHDLGSSETGLDAAMHLVMDVPREKWPVHCLVHSWNPIGAVNIETILRRAGLPHVVRRQFKARR